VSEPKPKDKSFAISKWIVWEAYQRVKANDGAAGVDGESIAEFERDLKGNLYKIWNRLSSGSYFPAPVRAVEIPKKHEQGKVRVLGVPTVADRIAQTVVRLYLEPKVEPLFHPDSYGYRPGRSALDAVGLNGRNAPSLIGRSSGVVRHLNATSAAERPAVGPELK
jgi:RNA-directed DNA polymerase